MIALAGDQGRAPAVEYHKIRKDIIMVVAAATPTRTVPELRAAYGQVCREIDQIPMSARRISTSRRKATRSSFPSAYEKKIPLFGPASLLLEYHRLRPGPGRGE